MRPMRIISLALLATANLAVAVLQLSPKLISLVAAAELPQALPTVPSVVDGEISAIEKQILDVAEAMPEEKFNFSPEGLSIRGSEYKGSCPPIRREGIGPAGLPQNASFFMVRYRTETR